MSMSYVEWPQLDAFGVSVDALADLRLQTLTPLFEEWSDILVEDNRHGILNDLDCNDVPMIPVTYRDGVKRPVRRRTGEAFGSVSGHPGDVGGFKGFGPFQSGLHNNLTAAEYRELTGPALAPRGENSRVITNYSTDFGPLGDGFAVTGQWLDVVSTKGVEFLPNHFDGDTLPKRDLCGLRRWGVLAVDDSLEGFINRILTY